VPGCLSRERLYESAEARLAAAALARVDSFVVVCMIYPINRSAQSQFLLDIAALNIPGNCWVTTQASVQCQTEHILKVQMPPAGFQSGLP
jgi:hypothetical protein